MEWKWITPYILEDTAALDDEAKSRCPSVGVIHHISPDIIVKLNYQYLVPPRHYLNLAEALYRRDCGLRSFTALHNEAMFYRILYQNPHENIIGFLHYGPGRGLFLRRASRTLAAAHGSSDEATRLRWVCELLSALSWIECLGYTHGDIAIRNLLVDKFNRLKVCDFDQITPLNDEAIAIVKESDHRALSTCIHFILTGIDPTDHSMSRAANEQRLKNGKGEIAPQAAILNDIINAGWLGCDAHRTFKGVEQSILEVISQSAGQADNCQGSCDSTLDTCKLQNQCQEWLTKAKIDKQWQDEEQHRHAWKAIGIEVDEAGV